MKFLIDCIIFICGACVGIGLQDGRLEYIRHGMTRRAKGYGWACAFYAAVAIVLAVIRY